MDGINERRQREQPDVDPSAKAITGRVDRLAGLFQEASSVTLTSGGIAALIDRLEREALVALARKLLAGVEHP